MQYFDAPQPNYNADSYDALALPGLAGDIYRELKQSTDPAIVLSSLVGFVSLLTQGLANVSWSNEGIAAVGTSNLCNAPSGSGKSYGYDQFYAPISASLAALESSDQKLVPELMIEDATREAIIEHLRDWPIAGLMSAESDSILKLLRTASPLLAKLLNGEEVRHARVGSGRMALRDHRLVVLMMIQPKSFDANKHLFGASSGGVGVINRFHIFKARDSFGVQGGFRRGMSLSTKAEYAHRAKRLLDQLVQRVSQKAPLPVLSLSPTAQREFEYQSEMVQRNLSQWMPDDYRTEYLLRHCERILRLAGALHIFNEENSSQIDLQTYKAAEHIGHISLNTYEELLYTPPKMEQVDVDAQCIEAELYRLLNQGQGYGFWAKNIQRSLINSGISKSRFDKAVNFLAGSKRIFVSYIKDQQYINLVIQPRYPNPVVFSQAFR